MMNGYRALTPAQAAATRALLAEESQRRTHVVVYLSGAHAYGFPSPDSDVDAKAIHVAPTRRLLGLDPRIESAERLEIRDGIEVDYSSNELGQVAAGLLRGNGNYLERLLGDTPLETGPLYAELAELARRTLSRRYLGHYRGFAKQQLAMADQKPTAKRLLYVLRTALTGVHLLRTGALVTDVTRLLDEHGYGDARALLAIKQQGERTPLEPEVAAGWIERLRSVVDSMHAAYVASPLPEEPAHVDALDAWLVEARVRFL
jgi:hypothetical protein